MCLPCACFLEPEPIMVSQNRCTFENIDSCTGNRPCFEDKNVTRLMNMPLLYGNSTHCTQWDCCYSDDRIWFLSVTRVKSHECMSIRLISQESRPFIEKYIENNKKKQSKPCITGSCVGNQSVTAGIPTQRANHAENVSKSWCHHGFILMLRQQIWQHIWQHMNIIIQCDLVFSNDKNAHHGKLC